jgi:hypothetical protein
MRVRPVPAQLYRPSQMVADFLLLFAIGIWELRYEHGGALR